MLGKHYLSETNILTSASEKDSETLNQTFVDPFLSLFCSKNNP